MDELDDVLDYEEEDDEVEEQIKPPTPKRLAKSQPEPTRKRPRSALKETPKETRTPAVKKVDTRTQEEVEATSILLYSTPTITPSPSKRPKTTKSAPRTVERTSKPVNTPGSASTASSAAKVKNSLSIMITNLPKSLCLDTKVRKHMGVYGELSEVKVDAQQGKAFIKYLTRSGANRAFMATTSIFNNASIALYRLPDHTEAERSTAESQAIISPNRTVVAASMNAKGNIKRSWNRDGVQPKAPTISAQESKEMKRVMLREQLAQKQVGLAKQKWLALGRDLKKQKEQLDRLSQSKSITASDKRQASAAMSGLMMQLKHADAAVTSANAALKSAQAAVKEMRTKFLGGAKKEQDTEATKS